MKEEKICVIGAGSWGTAFANYLAGIGHLATLWVRELNLLEILQTRNENIFFLPNIKLSENIIFTNSLEEAVKGKNIVIFAVPSKYTGGVAKRISDYLDEEAVIVSLTKGLVEIEDRKILRISEILREETGGKNDVMALSGPTFASEVALGLYTCAVIAGNNNDNIFRLQKLFSSEHFRFYGSNDLIGVELGGAFKNVIAIAAGISDGLGLGFNARAALINRGLMEMTHLATAYGAEAETLRGFSGSADLWLTATSGLSRNYLYGLSVGRGESPSALLKDKKGVIEGAETVKKVLEMAEELGVDVPICREVNKIIYGFKDPKESALALMNRELKYENM